MCAFELSHNAETVAIPVWVAELLLRHYMQGSTYIPPGALANATSVLRHCLDTQSDGKVSDKHAHNDESK